MTTFKDVKAFQKMLFKVKKRELKLSHALNNLGVMYYQGKGLDYNITKAVSLWSKAADYGSPEAQYNLAFMYYEGIRAKQDYEEALKWFAKVIDNENSDSATIRLCISLKTNIERELVNG